MRKNCAVAIFCLAFACSSAQAAEHPDHEDNRTGGRIDELRKPTTSAAHKHRFQEPKPQPENFVQPGHLEKMRTDLLHQIQAAEKRGVGISTYRAEFRKLNHLVAEGAEEGEIKARVLAIVNGLHGQIRTVDHIKRDQIIRRIQSRQLTKETLLIRPKRKGERIK